MNKIIKQLLKEDYSHRSILYWLENEEFLNKRNFAKQDIQEAHAQLTMLFAPF